MVVLDLFVICNARYPAGSNVRFRPIATTSQRERLACKRTVVQPYLVPLCSRQDGRPQEGLSVLVLGFWMSLDLPSPTASPITDQQIIAAASRPLTKDDLIHCGRTLGTNRGMLVVESLLWSNDRCGPQSNRVIHYDVPPGTACEKAGGLTQDRTIPYGITSGSRSFCISRVLYQPRYRVTRAMGIALQPRNVHATTVGSWITKEDYSAVALSAHEQGRVAYRFDIDSEGRVKDCNVISSSGSNAPDLTTCRVMQRRARLLPARDGHENAVSGSSMSAFNWRLS